MGIAFVNSRFNIGGTESHGNANNKTISSTGPVKILKEKIGIKC